MCRARRGTAVKTFNHVWHPYVKSKEVFFKSCRWRNGLGKRLSNVVSLALEPHCLRARPVFPPKAPTVGTAFIKLGVPLLSSPLAGQREVLGTCAWLCIALPAPHCDIGRRRVPSVIVSSGSWGLARTLRLAMEAHFSEAGAGPRPPTPPRGYCRL